MPADAGGAIQSSEQVVGPYALQDFNLFYFTRYGLPTLEDRISRASRMGRRRARCLAGGHSRSRDARLTAWEKSAIGLRVFLRRFFANQFKRSALPNGPKISSGGSLSPRGDWRAPSDADATVWLRELAENVPEQ